MRFVFYGSEIVRKLHLHKKDLIIGEYNESNEANSGVNTTLDGDTYPGYKIGCSVSPKKYF